MRRYTVQEVAATIDHAVPRPNQTEADLRAGAAMCARFRVASLCVRPCDIRLATACQIVLDAGADFVKTSTGFAPVSATPDAVRTMVRVVGGKIGVKASGGIRTWEQAVAYLGMGATRLGIGATETVLSGGTAEEPY